MPNTETAKLPPLYKKPQPLVASEHSKLKMKAVDNFDFAKDINSVIVTLNEVPSAALSCPIVFTRHGDEILPVVVLGVEGNKNSFVDKKGQWRQDTYVPAYIRRYPFIFMEDDNKGVLTLCADMKCTALNEKTGDPLFVGEMMSEATKKALEFCEMFHRELLATKPLCAAIDDAGLLEDRTATIKSNDKVTNSLTGFLTVNEEKLNKLDNKIFLKLRKIGALPLIYSHLISMRTWQKL